LLEDKNQHLLAEQAQWRIRQGQELSGAELRGVIEEYLQTKIEEIKPLMINEARRLNLKLQKKEWEGEVVVEAKTKAYEAGYMHGEKAGISKGKVGGYRRLTVSPTAKSRSTLLLFINANSPRQSVRHARSAIKLGTALVIWMGIWKGVKRLTITGRPSSCQRYRRSTTCATEQYARYTRAVET
jgi:hypothetical protein